MAVNSTCRVKQKGGCAPLLAAACSDASPGASAGVHDACIDQARASIYAALD